MKARLLIGLSFVLAAHTQAGSATWNLRPINTDWNTAANWTPNTVPNGPVDIATFGDSDALGVFVSAKTEVASITFSADASPYLITINGAISLTVSGAGIVDNSGGGQTIFARSDPSGISGVVFFTKAAAVADPMTFIAEGNSVANFGNGGVISFADTSTVAEASFINEGATVSGGFGGRLEFFDDAQAVEIEVTNEPGASADASGGFASFEGSASVANAVMTSKGASVSGAAGGLTLIAGQATVENGSLVAEGSSVSGGGGGAITLTNDADAGDSTLMATSGANGGGGGSIKMVVRAQAAGSRVILLGNGTLDTTGLFDRLHQTMIGSLEGDGIVLLGNASILVGSNNSSTIFSGLIQDGDVFVQGKIVKVGTGTLTLSSANTYTGTTTVSAGALFVSNQSGSATGTGAVLVNAGTLGGGGIIAGAVTVGTGSGAGAFLAPAFGTNKQVTLTLQSSLTLQADATYTYTFKARKNQSRTDLVIANGITINGASIALQGKTQGRVKLGTVLTVLSNTSANPLSGTFSNLADGAIVTVNGNNFQASYHGGDGNDLTLTVVP